MIYRTIVSLGGAYVDSVSKSFYNSPRESGVIA